MKKSSIYISLAVVTIFAFAGFAFLNSADGVKSDKTIYEFSFKSAKGETVKMSDYKGKTILIVNTATQCGLTPQFVGLETLNKEYKDKGLVIIGFPCNQFGEQAPDSNDEVEAVCLRDHGVTFQLTQKIDVNGDKTDPIYVYLKNQKSGLLGRDIKWNFAKFLISPEGNVVGRFAPTTKPAQIEEDIKKLLNL